MGSSNARVVYSSERGRVCPRCGWPADNCQCSSKARGDESIPGRLVARMRMEKSGRSGKTVTVIDGLPKNTDFLKRLGQELKRACGTGGTVLDDGVELQGDLRDRVREFLAKRGFVVKG